MCPCNWLNSFFDFLKGKKTYLIALSAFISLLVVRTNGKIDNNRFIEDCYGLALSITIRHGVTTGGLPPDVAADILLAKKKKAEDDIPF